MRGFDEKSREGGIFGHLNVGHAVRDPQVAASYLEHWTALSADPDGTTIKDANDQNLPLEVDYLVAVLEALHGVLNVHITITEVFVGLGNGVGDPQIL